MWADVFEIMNFVRFIVVLFTQFPNLFLFSLHRTCFLAVFLQPRLDSKSSVSLFLKDLRGEFRVQRCCTSVGVAEPV